MILSSTGLVQSMVKVVVVLFLTPLAASACLVPLDGILSFLAGLPARAYHSFVANAEMLQTQTSASIQNAKVQAATARMLSDLLCN